MKLLSKLSKYKYILIAILLLGCAVRIFCLDSAPYGLNQDEASSGYEAYAVMTYGIDRNGYENPAHLMSWGSGQNMAYSWLCMPFIAMLGLTVTAIRLPMAIMGCISVYIFYCLFKELWDEKSALWAAFFFAIYPWHIMKSRWGLESNIFPDLVLWGCWLLILYLKKEKRVYLYLAVLVLSFSVYSYGTAYMFMPFFVAGTWLYMAVSRKISWKDFALSALLFFVTALPIIMFVVINIFDLPEMQLFGFSIPRMYQRRFTTVTGTDGGFVQGCIENLKSLWRIFVNQGDGLSWNSLDKYGVCYLVFVPLIPLGIVLSAFYKKQYSFIMHWWAVCAVMVAAVTKVNVNRINIIFIPIAYYIAVSLIHIARWHKTINAVCIAGCFVLFTLFGKGYIQQNINTMRYHFYYSYGDAFTLAKSYDTEKVYVATDARYTLALFYDQTDPNVYLDTRVMTAEKVAFEYVGSFDRYYFYLPQVIDKNEDAVYMVKNSDLHLFDSADFDITSFFKYSVVVPKG